MAIDVPYHYQSAPRVEQNIRIESQNNWYLGAHREASDIQPLAPEYQAGPKPNWEILPKNNWQVAPAKKPVKKAAKSVHRAPERPVCEGDANDAPNCLAPK